MWLCIAGRQARIQGRGRLDKGQWGSGWQEQNLSSGQILKCTKIACMCIYKASYVYMHIAYICIYIALVVFSPWFLLLLITFFSLPIARCSLRHIHYDTTLKYMYSLQKISCKRRHELSLIMLCMHQHPLSSQCELTIEQHVVSKVTRTHKTKRPKAAIWFICLWKKGERVFILKRGENIHSAPVL